MNILRKTKEQVDCIKIHIFLCYIFLELENGRFP